ncbi:MAG TPA: YceI family protein [Polyangia bacterium]|nr:YceI family protein [Polyangia bacterium]
MEARERWEIDGGKSWLGFSLRHIVVSEIQGQFRTWGGEMTLAPDDVASAEIRVWVDVISIDTGSAERDAHVRSAEFLDTAQFPRAEFNSTAVRLRRDGEAEVTGFLQLHGISRPVDIVVVAKQTWLDDKGLMRAAYDVDAEIDRQAFGLRWNQDMDIGGFVVGDRVHLRARLEMVRVADADARGVRKQNERGVPAR